MSASLSPWVRPQQEAMGYLRRILRRPSVVLDGIEIAIDYRKWTPLLIHRVAAGRYEVEERRLIPDVVAPDDVVVEIGGAVGLVGMLCARIVGPERVFVYEANSEVLETAKENFARNGFDIAIEHAAVVSDECPGCEVTFYVSEHFWSSSLHDRRPFHQKQVAVRAPAVTISQVLRDKKPTVLIVDVEGAEYDILCGADLSSVQKICLEVHTRYLGAQRVSDLVLALLKQGFALQIERSIGEVLLFTRAGASPSTKAKSAPAPSTEVMG